MLKLSKHVLFVERHHPSNVHVLQGFEYHLKLWDKHDVSSAATLFQRVFDIVKYNLSSHIPIVRHLSLLILLHLSAQIEVPKVQLFFIHTFITFVC